MEQETENLDSQTEETTEETTTSETASEAALQQKEGETKEEFTQRERQYYERIKKLEAENADLKTKATASEDFVKKSELETENENLARQALNQSGNALDKEIVENWDELAPIYTKIASRGKNSKEAIIEDLRDAQVVWARNRATKQDTKATEAEIAAMRGTQGAPAKKTDEKPSGPKVIKRSRKMEDWFPSQD